MSQKCAIVIGAGVAGLSAAWWLHRIGWRPIVVERAPALRDTGYMIGLSGPGHDTAGRMGLHGRLESVAYAIHENVYRDRNGRELLRLRYRDFLKDLPYFALLRNDLVRAIADTLDPEVEIRYGTTVRDIADHDGGVTVSLSDGASLRADIAIGADGFRSQMRDRLFGGGDGNLRQLGYRFATYDLDDALGLDQDFLSYAEPGHMAEYYGLKEGRIAALHIWRTDDTDEVPAAGRWDLLERVAAHSHPNVRAVLDAARSGPPPLVDTLTLVDLPKWSQGRVVLLGDAAHCLTLVSGQGAGMAMASAEILSQELDRKPVPEALASHEARLRSSIERLQTRSRHMARVFIPETAFAFHLRNFWMRRLPRRWLGNYFLKSIKREIALAE